MNISVVVPVYGCKASLEELQFRLTATLANISPSYEIIYVDDACPDNSWDLIVNLGGKDRHVKGVKLSKNFGQHYAILAGLDRACGDWVIVMDCDLQDVPEEIERLYAEAKKGFDIVVGKREERQDSVVKRYQSKFFYSVLSYLTDADLDSSTGNFGIYSKRVVQSILKFREQNSFFPLLVRNVGYKKVEIPVQHSKRLEGKSSYNLSKLFNLAVDTMLAYSNKPLRLSIKLGFVVSLFSFGAIVRLIWLNFVLDSVVPGWTSVMVSMFFMFGIMFCLFGITGLYIGKIFNEVKDRPLYIVEDCIND